MSFSFYYFRKQTAITDKQCLQKVLKLAVWDDANPVSASSGTFSTPSALRNTHLMCSDYRLFQPKEHLSCQHLRYKLLPHDCVLFEFHRTLHFMSKSYSSSNVRKAAHPAGHTVWGFLRVYKATWGTFLHVILFSFSFHFCPLIPSTSQNWLNWDITHSAETATTELLTCSPIQSHCATYHCTFFGTVLCMINVFENYRPPCYDIYENMF